MRQAVVCSILLRSARKSSRSHRMAFDIFSRDRTEKGNKNRMRGERRISPMMDPSKYTHKEKLLVYTVERSPVFLSCSRPPVCPSDGTTVMLLCHCFFSFPALSSVAGLWPSLFPSTKMTFFSSLLTKISAIPSLIFFCLFWKPLWEPTAKEIRSCNLVFTLTTLGSFNVSRSGGPPRAFDYLIRIAERPARQEAKRSRRFLVIRFKSHFNNDRPAHKAPGVLK